MMPSSTISLDDGNNDESDSDDESDESRQYMINNKKKYAYYYIHPSYSSHYYKVGGCVGAFFQLFDWNRRLHSSNSKRFFSPHHQERKKQQKEKKKKINKKLQIEAAAREEPIKLLQFIPNELKEEDNPDIKVCLSSNGIVHETEYNIHVSKSKSPGAVGKLMGLESLPDHSALGKIIELNHPNTNSKQMFETSSRAMSASHPFEVNMIISEKKCINPNNISVLGKETTRFINHHSEVNMIISEKKCFNPKNVNILGKETIHIINHEREMLGLDGSKHNQNYKWKQKTRRVDRKLVVETRHANRNNSNVNQLHHRRLPCSKGNVAEYDTARDISSMSTTIEGHENESTSDSMGCQPSPVSVLVSPFDEEPLPTMQDTWRIRSEQDYVAAVFATTSDNKMYGKEVFDSLEERVASWNDRECGLAPRDNRVLLFDCVREAITEEKMMWECGMDMSWRSRKGMMWHWQIPCSVLVCRLHDRIRTWRLDFFNLSYANGLDDLVAIDLRRPYNNWDDFGSEIDHVVSSLERILFRLLLEDLICELNPQCSNLS